MKTSVTGGRCPNSCRKRHPSEAAPGSLPWNIYGTTAFGRIFDPRRDARLKVAFREFYDRSRQMVIEQEQLGPAQESWLPTVAK